MGSKSSPLAADPVVGPDLNDLGDPAAILAALRATGADEVSAGIHLAGAVGWLRGLQEQIPDLPRESHALFAHDLLAALPEAVRPQVAAVLEYAGVHPDSAALAVMELDSADNWTDLGELLDFAKTYAGEAGLQWLDFAGCHGDSMSFCFRTDPECPVPNNLVVPRSLTISLAAREHLDAYPDVPDGLYVEDHLKVVAAGRGWEGKNVRIGAGVHAGLMLDLTACPAWDGIIPADLTMRPGCGIRTLLHPEYISLDDWRKLHPNGEGR